ncbi:hypothetical protein ACSFA3_19210 [Variovorax sp. RHLX14]|uniref:hypothetical protein n=1 Tax=Variovorax sp. RHLX14 TaxID=1259731 RepID=UPI003F4561AB
MFGRLLIIAINLPVVAAAIFSCVYSIWFSKYQQRNVGPSLTYMAYALIALFTALLANVGFWIAFRKRISELRFLRNTTGVIIVFFLLSTWIGDRFRYVGERYALTHSLWSAIRMKDPPMFVPAKAEDAGKSYAQEPASVTSPCLKGCN